MAAAASTEQGINLSLTEEHHMIRQAARDFAQKEIAPIATEFDESGKFPLETIRKMGKMGFMGIEIAEKYGGTGMDTISYVLALEAEIPRSRRLGRGNRGVFSHRTHVRIGRGDDAFPRRAGRGCLSAQREKIVGQQRAHGRLLYRFHADRARKRA